MDNETKQIREQINTWHCENAGFKKESLDSLPQDLETNEPKRRFEYIIARNGLKRMLETFGKDKTDEASKILIKNGITEAFGIKEPRLFEKKFEQAVSGDGNELEKVFKANSSSLCCLLHFYKNKIALHNSPGIERFVSEYTAFEFKNPVVDKDHPSNIDVVLYNETKNIVVFLESKYAEFFWQKEAAALGISYFWEDPKTKQKPRIWAGKLKERLGIKHEYQPIAPALKQIISHYLGVVNRLSDPVSLKGQNPELLVEEEEINNIIKNGGKCFLGTIYEDHGKCLTTEQKQAGFDKVYKDETEQCTKDGVPVNYRALAKNLNKITTDLNKESQKQLDLTVLPEPIKYSDLRRWNDDKIDPIVKKFYGCGEEE